MKKQVIAGILVFLVALTSVFALVVRENNQVKGSRIVDLPDSAEVAPGVYSLGMAKDVDGTPVYGYAFVYKGHAKPTGCRDDGVCQGFEGPECVDCQIIPPEPDPDPDPVEPLCYGFMGAKWNLNFIEGYRFSPVNTQGLDENALKITFENSIGEWENQEEYAQDFIGEFESSVVDGPDTTSTDGKNEVMFGTIRKPGVIAVTIVWATSFDDSGEIREWDMVFDQKDFAWSNDATAHPGMMDFQNIATHELGHAIGMDDVYESECNQQTMYGYARTNEIIKRDLAEWDIFGIEELYPMLS
ncbi:matrixin family metalloprotease [Candidatus Woesearchaeota archaeon]|nr:matrixin family metalloprotease [Candidatus Woesearchaeota archaeon]